MNHIQIFLLTSNWLYPIYRDLSNNALTEMLNLDNIPIDKIKML